MDEIQTVLQEKLQNPTVFEIPLFGGIPVPQSAVVSWGIILLLTVLAIWLTHDLKVKNPGRRQMVAEMFVGLINNFCREILGEKHWRTFAPYLGTVGLYLLLANLAGLVGVAPPTKDLNVTAGLAIMSLILIYGSQFRYNGLVNGLKKYARPSAIITPLNVLEMGIRPLALCMRLFGNILGAFIIMELIKAVAPAVIPVAFSLYFDIFDGVLQAVVFVFLTTLFLSESLEPLE
ncbi:MAG TPA: F0F1 ATP synthase subunit A [Candidatus Evtepia faecigallinarum]|nr:F0F1 ATP synthase subunit A [Candidatus Evtepia faecigallinarum]